MQKEILFRGFPGPNSHFSEGRANLVLPNCRDGCCRTPVRCCRERCQTAAVSPSRQSDGSSLLRRLILQEPQFVGVATETSRGRRLPIAVMEPNDFEAISPCHAEKARAKQARPAGRADRTRPQRATAQSDWMVDFCRCFTGASRCWLAVCCETEPWIPAGKNDLKTSAVIRSIMRCRPRLCHCSSQRVFWLLIGMRRTGLQQKQRDCQTDAHCRCQQSHP